MNVDIHEIVEHDELVAMIHSQAEVFDKDAEEVFAYLQVQTHIDTHRHIDLEVIESELQR